MDKDCNHNPRWSEDIAYCKEAFRGTGMEDLAKDVINQITEAEDVNHPAHYTQGGIEVIDYIKAWDFDYLEGNIIKYVSRYKYKGTPHKDLLKARQYLDWLIEREEQKEVTKKRNKERTQMPITVACPVPGTAEGSYGGTS